MAKAKRPSGIQIDRRIPLKHGGEVVLNHEGHAFGASLTHPLAVDCCTTHAVALRKLADHLQTLEVEIRLLALAAEAGR